MQTPRLTVLGAGPGDPELLTLKGARVLSEADVILYDALANCALLVDYARRYGHVVRLKGGGGDPFGRGREEMLHAEAHGLLTDYVPGISSAVAAARTAPCPTPGW